jgi:serine phosphatase RsbU (regulator of sigma subunit)
MLFSEKIKQYWSGILIHPTYRKDEKLFLKAKTMVQAFMLTSLFSFAYLFVSYLIGFSYGISLMWFTMISFLLFPLMLRFKIPLNFLGNLYLTVGSFAVVVLIYYSGGLHSPVLPWLAASPTLALMLMGKRYAILWAFLMVSMVVVFGYLAYLQVELPYNFNPEWHFFFYVLVIVGLILIVLFINLIFQNSKEKAYQLIAAKNIELNEALLDLKEARSALEKSHNDIVLINHELIRQKELTENKNNSITSSLRYAKNMQNALMPNPYILQSLFADSFFLTKPLKIVSGDFFWVARANGLTYAAVVDCTGHGVPGALMSVIGNNLLKEAAKLRKLTDPVQILQFLQKGVSSALNQAETYNHDGMEIGLCILDEDRGEVSFCGAKISLLYIKDSQLHYIKADNMAIGGMNADRETSGYQVHTIKIDSPTKFYLFTDGLKDQFGGAKGKKFMLSRVKQTIEHVQQLPMPMQKSYIAEILNDWMKGEEQVDDITIVGFQPVIKDRLISPSGTAFGLMGNN